MVKVRVSQIPEDNGKPKFQNKNMTTKVRHADDYRDEELDGEEEDSSEQKRLNKTVIHFSDDGVVISAYDLHTIEKDMRFVEKPTAHWEFGITINKGLEQSQFVKKSDVSMWYSTEELRDEKWKKLMTILESEGLSVINI